MQNMQTIDSNKSSCVDSRDVAEMLGRRHAAVLRDIDNIRDGFENEFKLDEYQTDNPRTYRKYMMTEKGFKLLLSNVNGFNHIKVDMENVFLSLTDKKGGEQMQELQTINIENNSEFGPVVSSRTVAEELGKRPSDVLMSLNNILTNGDFRSLIIPSEYKDKKGETRKECLLTKDGFTLYMFNIQGHNDFKMAYINKFNEMDEHIKEQSQLNVPQTPMQALEMMFSVQKEQQEFNNRIETEVTGIRNIVGMETKNWRNDTNKVLGAIAQHLGGGQKHKTVRMEAYKLLEEKGRCKLEQRLNNRKAKMLAKGATKTQINKLSKLDVINDEPRLIEIYISAIKSMAIKYGVDINQLEI